MSHNEASHELYSVQMVDMLQRVDQEITGVVGQIWQDLKGQNNTFVNRHSLLVLAMAIRDPVYAGLPAE